MTADGDPEQVSALLALLPEAEAQRTPRGGVKGAQAAYGLPAQLTPTPAAAALPPIVLLQLELPLAPMLAEPRSQGSSKLRFGAGRYPALAVEQ